MESLPRFIGHAGGRETAGALSHAWSGCRKPVEGQAEKTEAQRYIRGHKSRPWFDQLTTKVGYNLMATRSEKLLLHEIQDTRTTHTMPQSEH